MTLLKMKILCLVASWALVLGVTDGGASERETQPNRLIHESSPYLRLHAFNPVDWHVHELIYGYVPAIIAGFIITRKSFSSIS